MCLRSLSFVLAPLLAMILILVCINTRMAQAQSQGSEERPGTAPSGLGQSAASTRGSSGGGSMRVVPSITVSERYDSNVLLFVPKIYDYVTNIRPGARVQYKDNLVDGALTGGLVSEVYARNPQLNYVGADASFDAILDQAVGRMVRGLGLRITDSVIYTPQQQAFLTPQASETSFIYGLQAYRNNSITNAANILGTYAITPLAQVNASYSHQMMRFLNQRISGLSGGLFNTTVQSLSAGAEYRTAPTQSIGVLYQYQQMSFESSLGSTDSGFNQGVQSAMATWRASLTRELTAEVSPGAAIVSSFPGELQWTMRGRLGWSDGKARVGLSYSRSVSPGFFLVGSALISNTVSLSLSQVVANQWDVNAQSDYATSSAIGGTAFGFESFGQTVGVSYSFYPGMVATASATYNSFSFNQGGPEIKTDRQLVMLSLRAEWN